MGDAAYCLLLLLSDAERAKRKPSAVGGDIVMISLMLFAFIEAASLLRFSSLAAQLREWRQELKSGSEESEAE
jgi:hypothetical protein